MTKKIINTNFVVFMYEVQEAIQEGYRLSEDFVPGYYGYHYEAELTKEKSHTVVEKQEDGSAIIRNATSEERKETEEQIARLKEPAQEEKPAEAPKRGRKPAGK